jgi:hypothetical protein
MLFDWWRGGGWDVATHAGFLTYPHHDASGLVSFLLPRCGAKIWILMRLHPDHEPRTIDELFDIFDWLLAEPQSVPPEVQIGSIVLEEGHVL